MRQKLFVAAILFLMAVVPTFAAKYTVKVNGNPNMFKADRTLLLVLSTEDSLQIIGNAEVDASGTATFTGAISRPNALAYLQMGNYDRFRIPVILEDGTVVVSQDVKINMISASGTPLNDAYNKIFEDGEKINEGITDEKQRIVNSKKVRDDAFSQHAGDALGAMLFLGCYEIKENDQDVMQKMWSRLGEYPKSLKEVRDLRDRVIGYNACHEGMKFKDFTIKDGTLDGKDVTLSDFVGKGKYVFVDFWASWCSACRAELPNVRIAYADNKGKNIDFIGILIWDKRKAAEKAVNEEGLPWTQLIDIDGVSGRTYGISFIPQTFLFAPDGTLLKIGLRGKELNKYLKENVK